MIQFTKMEQQKLREKSSQYPKTIKKLKAEVDEIFKSKAIVPETGIANWTLYYYCPDCSVQLVFDRNSEKDHICPCCGKHWTGEPYDSSWWGLINSSNYNAAFKMAIIWLATGDNAYADKAVELLRLYAKHYPNYEIHGNIPYNGPGRSGAQTLDEANFQRSFAMTYDILSDYMSEEDRILIRDQMLLPGAEFLLKYRHRQLHNHEVIINSAIAVIGILFQRPDYVKAALYEDYGILYQLNHGVLEHGMWFEGAFGYHFYALTSFFAFEKFALHTEYSNIHHPNYKRMMELLTDYLEPDDSIPMLNDTNYGHMEGMKNLYEFAYRELGGDKLAYVLNTYYKSMSRDNLEAFLYGADTIPEVTLSKNNFHTELNQYGHTVLRGKEQRYLLFKHDSYGGEHDHYDRLGISYLAFGRPVSRDLGTTGYGAKMHYDYYKNTGTHNTLVIGEENQAPVNGRLTRYEEKNGIVYVEAVADWTVPYQMPDSFTITQWSEENYKNVRMKRMIAWADTYFVEVFLADGIDEDKTADWVMHVSGVQIQNSGTRSDRKEVFSKKPFCHLKNLAVLSTEHNAYQVVYEDEGIFTSIYGLNNQEEIITAIGPDNPSSTDIAYLIERRQGGPVCAAHVIETWNKQQTVEKVEFKQTESELSIEVHHSGIIDVFRYSLEI